MRRTWRYLAATAVGTLLILSISAPDVTAGRDDTRCKQACRNTKIACDAACDSTCIQMFPTNFEQRYACIRECKATCTRQEQECRLNCAIDRPPVTPTEP